MFKTTHNESRTRFYLIWYEVKRRCRNKNTIGYKRYGGRGITYDPKWETFEGFAEDMREGYADNLSIDRIDNNKGYSKENCKWSTKKEQAMNRNTTVIFKGECMEDASKRLTNGNGRTSSLVSCRIKRGWSIEDAFTKPLGYRKKSAKNYYFHKGVKKWHVRVNKKSVGYYDTEQEAITKVKYLEELVGNN